MVSVIDYLAHAVTAALSIFMVNQVDIADSDTAVRRLCAAGADTSLMKGEVSH